MKPFLRKSFLIHLLLLFFTGTTIEIKAQSRQGEKAEKKIEQKAFIDARDLYLRIVEKGDDSPTVLKNLGDSYYMTSDYADAIKWYQQLIQTSGTTTVSSESYFRYAQSLKSEQQYEEADRMMEIFKKLTNTDSRGQMFANERDYLKEIEKQSGRYRVETVDFNSTLQDFSPSFYNGRLVISSNRKSRTGKLTHDWNDQPFLDLYVVDFPESDSPLIARFDDYINTEYHESSSVFNKAGNVVYFTRNNYTDKKLKRDQAGTINLKLYRSFRESGKWTIPVELPFNSDEYSVAHPALSTDEKTLYFSSNMPGTIGLSDIWSVSIQDDGSYGEPQNLGNTINTEGRENFPFVADNNRLFFSSDGHIGLGGLDVYVARILNNKTYGKAYNAGKPVNSSADDFSLILDNNSGIGYFASNRKGGLGNDDIYKFIREQELLIDCNQTIRGITRDLKTDEVIANAKILLRNADNNVIDEAISDPEGNFIFKGIECNTNYTIRSEKETFQPAEVIITTDADQEREVIRDLYLKQQQEVLTGNDLNQLLELQPIYFDLNKSNIRPDAQLELNKVIAFMEQFPNSKIDVRSHTDNRASDAYNMALSQRRNKATLNYLMDKGGISADRLTGKGYGESQLINKCPTINSCTEGEHQINRRSEFIILKR